MKFCMQQSFCPPRKHSQFQEGRKGHKAKGHKAKGHKTKGHKAKGHKVIKAGCQNLPKYFVEQNGFFVCELHQFLRAEVPIITEAI